MRTTSGQVPLAPKVRGTLALVLLSLVLLAACGEAGPALDAGVATWALEGPVRRIGSLDDPETSLTRVTDVELGPDGGIYVLQPQDFMVRVFSQDGSPLRSIGGQGEGPGELRGPSRMGFLGDTLWIRDSGAQRVSFYRHTGEYLTDQRFPTVPGLDDEAVRATFVTLAARGQALLSTSAQFGSGLEGSDRPFPILALPREGGTPDTLAFRNTVHDRAMFVTTSGGEIQAIEILQQVFSDVTLWEVEEDGDGIVVVDRYTMGDPDLYYRLIRVALSGDTVFSVRRPYRPVPIAPERIDSLVTRYTRSGRSESEVRDVLFLPEHHPPASQVVAATDGSIWVGREEVTERPVAWDVFSADGARQATLQVPPGLEVHWTDGQTLWGVETDELDVPYVVQYSVVPGRRP